MRCFCILNLITLSMASQASTEKRNAKGKTEVKRIFQEDWEIVV